MRQVRPSATPAFCEMLVFSFHSALDLGDLAVRQAFEHDEQQRGALVVDQARQRPLDVAPAGLRPRHVRRVVVADQDRRRHRMLKLLKELHPLAPPRNQGHGDFGHGAEMLSAVGRDRHRLTRSRAASGHTGHVNTNP